MEAQAIAASVGTGVLAAQAVAMNGGDAALINLIRVTAVRGAIARLSAVTGRSPGLSSLRGDT